ncbi:efflux RND transporter periplasmic adaptor subunit [Horticoccus luteus]|uniref:Efflux RND transporter periplasmic adaptor subunit n=1 Tax=Horticoccus luteus TaxID=2862869 RepID=A0A8F9XG54_9BACT|nr:HlyD family efflux transporter periplasmic adaptor subunit [Horticoccus luteus]QYM78787.1 efflux RND transporter periplasmic adaptor subunit [Horticoccus luteus]
MLPVLAAAGLGIALVTVAGGDHPTSVATLPAAAAPTSPYAVTVAGAGLVEANTENIVIATPLPGLVTKVFVALGDQVEAGMPLFALDDRGLRADLLARRAAIPVAQSQLAQAKYLFDLAASLSASQAMSTEDRETRRFALQKAQAELAQAEADVKAGELQLDRLVVRAPIAGEILQLKIHAGEYATPASPTAGEQPLLLLGDVSPLHVRVDVDEFDAGRLTPTAPATGFLRGRPDHPIPLTFVRLEPYVLPKHSLTGSSTERVDTRVLQVIYRFDPHQTPAFVGQQMDVFIAGAAEASGAAR